MQIIQSKTKTIGTFSVVLIFTMHFSQAQPQYPKVSWWYDTKDFSAGQSAAKDFDGDGNYELVFGCYRNDGNIYAINAENGSLLWKFDASVTGGHGCNGVAAAIFDVDGDGQDEVIVPASCNPKTYCFNGQDGSVKWICNTRGSDSPPTIADIDNDGKPEIIHGEFGGWVICINAEDGTVNWEMQVDPDSWVQTAPTIVDLDRNGILDFVVATWNFSYKDSIFAFRGDNLNRLWAFPVHDHIYHGTAVSDLDQDGKPELVIGSWNDTLYCLNGENGTTNFKYTANGSVTGPVSLGDIDNDGVCDIVFGDGYGITALSNTGKLKWYYTIPNSGYTFRGVALADITNDKYLDVIFGTYNTGVLYALHGNNGNLIWNLNLASHFGNPKFGLNHAPLVADFDQDDILDIFIVGGYGVFPPSSTNFGRAYMISAGKGNGPEWLMFQRDIHRQSSLCSTNTTQIDDKELQSKIKIYPNPGSGMINIDLKDDCPYVLFEIIDIRGKTLFKTKVECGNLFSLDVTHLDDAIYFYRATSPEGIAHFGKLAIFN